MNWLHGNFKTMLFCTSIATVLIFLFWNSITNFAQNTYSYFKTIPVICNDHVVPYKTSIVENPNITSAESYTEQGKQGNDRICKGRDGSDQGKIVTPAVDEIIHKGTKPVAPAPEYTTPQTYSPPLPEDNGYTAICNDGTGSYSVGRGTCSRHGGIAYYTN